MKTIKKRGKPMKEKYIKPFLMKVDLVEELIMNSGPTPTPCPDEAPCPTDVPCSTDGPCSTDVPCSTDGSCSLAG